MAYPGYPPKSQSVQGQPLDITVVGCYNLADKEWFSRQDPYVVIDYSGQKFRTRTATDGGRNPSFNETFKLSMIEGLREVSASVWNSNTIERDDYIGNAKILLNKVIESGYDDTQWQLTNSATGKTAGALKLILHFAGGGAGKTKPGKSDASQYAAAAPPSCYAASACGAASHSHHHYPPQQQQQPYPQAPVPYCAPAPQVPAFVPVYPAPPQPAYPAHPVAYVAPLQPAFYGAPAYPHAPAYPPQAYPQAPYNAQWGRGL